MTDTPTDLDVPADFEGIGPDEIAYRLPLTAAELKITHAALHALLDGYGHREHDVRVLVHGILDKLPDRRAIESIDLRRAARARAR